MKSSVKFGTSKVTVNAAFPWAGTRFPFPFAFIGHFSGTLGDPVSGVVNYAPFQKEKTIAIFKQLSLILLFSLEMHVML